MKSAARAIAIMTSIALLLAVLAACNPSSQSSSSTTTLTVATVNNNQMVQMEQLTKQVFQKDHPNIKVNFVTLPENDLRSKVTQDVATNAGKFDVATIGSYETPIWAQTAGSRISLRTLIRCRRPTRVITITTISSSRLCRRSPSRDILTLSRSMARVVS